MNIQTLTTLPHDQVIMDVAIQDSLLPNIQAVVCVSEIKMYDGSKINKGLLQIGGCKMTKTKTKYWSLQDNPTQ